jgi:signal transduction histidine kinase
MQSAEIAMAERRMVSAYVHDQLGQNLGYMQLKLDQLSTNENIDIREVQKELNRLREVANDSYEIVRDILKKMQPETVPHLTNLLHEHARTVSRRSKLALNFQSMGKPLILSRYAADHFFAFREVLLNVEKHASADAVDVSVSWNDGCLDILVKDNGKGFDMATVRRDEHFGLDIMKERLSHINGMLKVNTSRDAGTVVSISIPLGYIKEAIV